MTDSLARTETSRLTGITTDPEIPGRPEAKVIQRVQQIRKTVLLIAILAVVALSMVTGAKLTGGIAHALILGAGVVALAVAVVGRAWCSLYIGGRKKSELVDRGPYSVSRNPLYVFSFIGAFGMGAQTGSLSMAVLFMAIAVTVFIATVNREEAWLLGMFAQPYRRYLDATPRFWPRWSSWKDATEMAITPKYFLTTLRDGSVMFLAIPLFWGITLLHEASRLPIIFRLV